MRAWQNIHMTNNHCPTNPARIAITRAVEMQLDDTMRPFAAQFEAMITQLAEDAVVLDPRCAADWIDCERCSDLVHDAMNGAMVRLKNLALAYFNEL